MECGWTREYIYNNLSFQDIVNYYESIQGHKVREYKLMAQIIGYSSAFSRGAIKQEDWVNWVESIGKPKEKPPFLVQKTVDELKEKGILIEDT